MANPAFETSPEILQIKRIFMKHRKIEASECKSKSHTNPKHKQTKLYFEPINILPNESSKRSYSARKRPPRVVNSNYKQFKDSDDEWVENSNKNNREEKKGGERGKGMLQGRKQGPKYFTAIREDGWCTPWAETLDQVNVFFFGGADSALLAEARGRALALGAGETENIEEATHVVVDSSADLDVIESVVRVGGV